MKRIILSKHLNNTELGKGNTHEGYFYINTDLKPLILKLMPSNEREVSFTSLSGGEDMTTRLTITRNNTEYRLPGLGSFFYSLRLNTEDVINLIFDIDNDSISYYYSVEKHDNALCLKWNEKNKGFEIISLGRNHILDGASYRGQTVSLVLKSNTWKRSDSPNNTPYYDLMIGNSPYNGSAYKNVFLEVKNHEIRLDKYENWTIDEIDY